MSETNAPVVVTGNADNAPSLSGQRTFSAYIQTCRLLTLPAELRLHINKLVLVQGPLGREDTVRQHTLRPPSAIFDTYETKDIALLATCQQIHDEAIQAFYSYNIFVFPALVQDLARCFQAQPTFSLMQYIDLRPFSWTGLVRSENGALTAVDACIRIIVEACPALKSIKIQVYYDFAGKAKQKWEFLDASPNLVWYTFQAFPMRDTQQTSLVAMNSKRMDEVSKVWDLEAAKNGDGLQGL